MNSPSKADVSLVIHNAHGSSVECGKAAAAAGPIGSLQFTLMVLHTSFSETVTLIYLSGAGGQEDIEIPADGCRVYNSDK